MKTLKLLGAALAAVTMTFTAQAAKAAIRQIREKGYAAEYKGDRRPVTLVGVNFRLSKRNIDEPLFAKL